MLVQHNFERESNSLHRGHGQTTFGKNMVLPKFSSLEKTREKWVIDAKTNGKVQFNSNEIDSLNIEFNSKRATFIV